MQTSVLIGLVALTIVGVGAAGASGIMAPAGTMQGGMGGGMMGGGSGMNGGMMDGGSCGCQTDTNCQQSMYDHNHTGDHGGMMP